jgi:hypothetical protein
VPALMPEAIAARKYNPDGSAHGHGSWFAIANSKHRGARTSSGTGARLASVETAEGRKGAEWFDRNLCALPSGLNRRKAASARIAKIPFALSHWIARTYLPEAELVRA